MERHKIIVGVHGIGDQCSFDTIQSIARQVCKYYRAPGAIPLGRFNSALNASHSAPFFPESPPDPPLPPAIGFAEVYWADIPRETVSKGYTLEEAKRWAKTIVDRLRSNYPGDFTPRDYRAIKRILEEMIDTIAILERLFFLADKAGLFRFELKKLLYDYLGDVQLVTDFKGHRRRIVERFFDVMEGIHAADGDAEIYIIAHSEGTVISFVALLEAMCADPANRPPWLPRVRGLMTIGSPIDKHLLLWPELWRPLEALRWDPPPAERIRWVNYYDYGDPVGFMLDTARLWLESRDSNPFDFSKENDFGFGRYYLPGKAHVDYWDDDYVFGHFLSRVVDSGKTRDDFAVRPPDVTSARLTSYVVSYAIVALFLFGGVYLLYKSVAACIGADTTPLAILRNVAGIAALLGGITMSARIPRLTHQRSIQLIGPAVFLCSALLYPLLVEPGLRESLGKEFIPLGVNPTAGVIMLAGAVLAAATFLSKAFPKWGMKPLLISGGCAVAGIIAVIVLGNEGHGAVWPIFPAAAVFLYLWWLAALVFDLIFVWHRYIRQSKALIRLHDLYRQHNHAASART